MATKIPAVAVDAGGDRDRPGRRGRGSRRVSIRRRRSGTTSSRRRRCAAMASGLARWARALSPRCSSGLCRATRLVPVAARLEADAAGQDAGQFLHDRSAAVRRRHQPDRRHHHCEHVIGRWGSANMKRSAIRRIVWTAARESGRAAGRTPASPWCQPCCSAHFRRAARPGTGERGRRGGAPSSDRRGGEGALTAQYRRLLLPMS